uniref:hypothetical protein n=1 Tax=Lachnospira eligens TaxID=39485 RepID=UPI00402527AE
METWRITIPIVVFILCVIGAWYAIRLRIKEIRSRTYVYPKTGYKYMPLYRCWMKNPVSGEWFNALIYQGMESGELYVREYEDFFDKFVKLLDWENETKESGQC